MTLPELEEMEAKEAFLDALHNNGFIHSTCKRTRMDEAVVRHWMSQDVTFANDIASLQQRLARRVLCNTIRGMFDDGCSIVEINTYLANSSAPQ